MSRHYTIKEPRFDIEFRPSERATAHGGQMAVAALAREYGLWKKVNAQAALDRRTDKGKGFDPSVYVAALVFGFTSGGDSLADCERLNDDEALKSLLGIKRFPDQTAVGEWLRNIGWEGVAVLRRLNREFVQWALKKAEAGRVRHAGQLESFFDDTQIEVEGKHFQGAAINYEGRMALSWQVLMVGPFVADGVLGRPPQDKEARASDKAGADVSGQLPGMLRDNRALWDKPGSYLYADSASSAGKYLEAIDEHFGQWSVSYNKWVGPLELKSGELPGNSWGRLEVVKWRDGQEHQAQYNWLRYQPEGCQTPQLFAVVRHRRAEGELFWRYAFVVCKETEQTTDPKRVFERHRLKGDKERVFSELLSDFDLHHPPCKSLVANNAYYLLGLMAFNLLQTLKVVYLPAEHQPKRIKTLLHHLLLIPVEIKRHARRLKAACYIPAGWIAWWSGFLKDLLPRCRQFGALACSTA